MKNFEFKTATLKDENEEIKQIFDKQAKFLKSLMFLAVVQYVILLAIL